MLDHEHHPADTPYQARHAIFFREVAQQGLDIIVELPEVIRTRLISLRAFDTVGNILHADLEDGSKLEQTIKSVLANSAVAYFHAH